VLKSDYNIILLFVPLCINTILTSDDTYPYRTHISVLPIYIHLLILLVKFMKFDIKTVNAKHSANH